MLRHLQRTWRTLPITSNTMTPRITGTSTTTSTTSICPSCTRSFANEAKAIPTHTPAPEAANPGRPRAAVSSPSTSQSGSSSSSSSSTTTPAPSPDTLPPYLRDHPLFSTVVNDINLKNEQYDSAATIAAKNTHLGGTRQNEYHVRKLQFDQQVRAFRKKYRDEYQERFRIAQTKATTQAKTIKAASRARIFAKEESNRVVHLKGQVYMLKRKQKQQQVAIQKHKNRLVFEAQRRNQQSYQLSYLRWERTHYWIRDMDHDLHTGIFDQELVLPGWWPSKPAVPQEKATAQQTSTPTLAATS